MDIGADDVAVVCDEAEGTLSARPGVEKADVREESERSGTVPADCADVSARPLRAADIPQVELSVQREASGSRFTGGRVGSRIQAKQEGELSHKHINLTCPEPCSR